MEKGTCYWNLTFHSVEEGRSKLQSGWSEGTRASRSGSHVGKLMEEDPGSFCHQASGLDTGQKEAKAHGNPLMFLHPAATTSNEAGLRVKAAAPPPLDSHASFGQLRPRAVLGNGILDNTAPNCPRQHSTTTTAKC